WSPARRQRECLFAASDRFGLPQRQKIGFVESLVFEQEARAAFEHLALRPQQIDGPAERAVDNRFDSGVDLACGFLAIAPLGYGHLRFRPAEKIALALLIDDLAERLGHAVARHDAARDIGHLDEVVGGAGRELAEDDLFGRAAAE